MTDEAKKEEVLEEVKEEILEAEEVKEETTEKVLSPEEEIGKLKADAGIMISASHNPCEFNGIKISRFPKFYKKKRKRNR